MEILRDNNEMCRHSYRMQWKCVGVADASTALCNFAIFLSNQPVAGHLDRDGYSNVKIG